jgi:glycosyltransferase involved in cell wall biosynthesis
MSERVAPCLLVPHYEHLGAVGEVLARLVPHGLPVVVVDDGSSPATVAGLRACIEALGEDAGVELLCLARNGGKGTALRAGYRWAARHGYTHTLELDADGQHDSDDVPRFVAAMHETPEALLLGAPIFDESAPKIRLWGRQLSRGLVWAACGSRAIHDPLCGFRGVPLASALAVIDHEHTGDHMCFDAEFATRMYRAGVPVRNVPTRVRYPADGVSHFDMLRDNLRLAATYVRLLAEPLAALVGARRPQQATAGNAGRTHP